MNDMNPAFYPFYRFTISALRVQAFRSTLPVAAHGQSTLQMFDPLGTVSDAASDFSYKKKICLPNMYLPPSPVEIAHLYLIFHDLPIKQQTFALLGFIDA